MKNGEQIREEISLRESAIREMMCPDIFILNPKISQLYAEIEKLREQCEHKEENGYCMWCKKKMTKEE